MGAIWGKYLMGEKTGIYPSLPKIILQLEFWGIIFHFPMGGILEQSRATVSPSSLSLVGANLYSFLQVVFPFRMGDNSSLCRCEHTHEEGEAEMEIAVLLVVIAADSQS